MTHRGPFQPLPFCDSVKKRRRKKKYRVERGNSTVGIYKILPFLALAFSFLLQVVLLSSECYIFYTINNKWCAIKKHESICVRSPGSIFRVVVTAEDMKYGHLMHWLIPLNVPKEENKAGKKPQRNQA